MYRLIILFIFFTTPVFAAPELKIRWLSSQEKSFEFRIQGEDEILKSCLDSGLDLKYRFEAQICRRRGLWFDRCLDEMVETHQLTYDPVSQNYNLVMDRHRDGHQPESKIFMKREKAVAALRRIKKLPLSFLSAGRGKYENLEKTYISARAFSHCQGEYSQTIAQLSYFLTLGLVRITGFDTGWKDYRFD